MSTRPIRFDDGAAYEEFMGKWTYLAGDVFLQWLAPASGLRWIDVGCGNGAFTELVAQRCAPALLAGIDPSAGQLDFARRRPALRQARLEQGEAASLPHADASFDIAIMALVLFFVPDPAMGVAEMRRVVGPGGQVAAYSWDIFGGGFPTAAMQTEMRALGMTPQLPPSAESSRQEAMRALWTDAGLVEVELRQISVEREFRDFDDYWAACMNGPSMSGALATKPVELVDELKARTRAALPTDAAGRITVVSRANAIKGRSPV